MNEVMNYEFKGNKVRGVLIDGNPYFVGKDVATILGYSKPRNAILTHVDDEDKKVAPIKGDLGGVQQMTAINESGLYSLILSSKLPAAKEFKRWVTSEVLPTLRKQGFYAMNKNDLETDMKVVINNMVTLTNNLTILSEATTTMCQKVTELVAEVVKAKQEPVVMKESITFEGLSNYQCKLDSFPEDLKQIVNSMMEEMRDSEQLNFSKIARLCVVKGYAITSPAVKTYYEKHFKKGQ